ncbi:cyclin-dependent kinase inhibitor 1-like isoform X2 [Apus apus]|uniref:cyclin-dependent kinase inhibitor 1-like isoform X2 n=1 Tax=Apus apus TaxID=8895 RepID=UPI0021F8D517|nr:cyclin-dependent kinase inhibitor 1-like isoform X2 [Apus apus]
MESLLCTLVGEQHQGEKVERRPGKTARAQRNLFGPVDHEQLQQDFQHMLCNSIEGAQQKWNFDFLRDVPVEGLLQWEELEGREVPVFYRSCVVRDDWRSLQHLNWARGRADKSHHFAQGTLNEKPKTSKKPAGKRVLEGRKRGQTALTDYYSTKKQVKVNMQGTAKNSAS